MAEEVKEEGTPSPPPFDEAKMQEFIKAGVKASIQEAIAEAPKPTEVQPKPTEPENPFAQWVNPLVDPKLQAASLTAQAAEDKVDFYSSDEWLTEVDDWLVSDDPVERKKEKAAIREEIEKTFIAMLKAGKGTFRKDIASYVMMEKIKRDKTAFQESIGKRSTARKEAELERARRGVDIGAGALSNFTPQDIHEMPTEKMLEQYGGVAF